jgi:WD40 repeat protein
MNLKVISLATILSLATPIIPNLLIPSKVTAIPQLPIGTFSNEQWSVSLQYENNTYYYQGRNKQSGNTLNLSGAQLSGTSKRPIYTWRNGGYRYQIVWQPNDPDFVRLQVFAQNDKEILNRLLTRTTSSVATPGPSNITSTTSSSTTGTNSSIITAWEKAELVLTIEDRNIRGNLVEIFDVALSEDGRYVVSGNNEDHTKIWEMSSGNEVSKFKFNQPDSGRSRRTYSINSVEISPDNQYLVSGSGNMVEVRQFPSGHVLHRRSGTGSQVVIRANREQFVSGLSDNQIKVWKLRSGDLIKELPDHIQVSMGQVALDISADGQHLVGGGAFGKINVWNLETGNLERKLNSNNEVISTAISPKGNLVFTSELGSADVIIWNVRTGEIIRSLQGHSALVGAIEVSPDGQILATGSADGTIRLWNLKTRELVRVLENNAGAILSLDFSSDSQTLATSTKKGKIVIWQAQ